MGWVFFGFKICQGVFQGCFRGQAVVWGRTGVGVGLGLASAGPGLRSQEGAGGWGFRAAREGMRAFAFNARFGLVPLPLFRCAGGVGLCASRDRLWGGDGLVLV